MAINATQMSNQALNSGNIDAIRNASFTPLQSNEAGADSGIANGVKFVVEGAETSSAPKLEEARVLTSNFILADEMPPIGDLKLGNGPDPRQLDPKQPYFTAVENWQKILPDMPEGAFGEQLLSQLRGMRKGGILPNTRDFLRMLAAKVPDVSVQYAMLQTLAMLASIGDKDILALIKEANKELMAENGAAIRAGVNIAETVNAKTADPEKMQELRDLYRQEVGGYKSPLDCIRSLAARSGSLDAELDFLVESAEADLNSKALSPSRDPEELGRIMSDLKNVQSIKSTCDEVTKMIGRMGEQFGETASLGAAEATERLITLMAGPAVSKEDIAAFIGELGAKGAQTRYDCCKEFQKMMRKLPDSLFAGGNEARLGAVAATQALLDDLTAELEEA